VKPFHVVIPSKNANNLTACLDSIFRMEPVLSRERIIVVDDGVDPEFRERVEVRWIDGQKPFIFSRAANDGIEAAHTDLILMNDDSRLLTASGFTNLVNTRPSEYGLVSAAIRENVGNLQQKPAKTCGIRPIVGAIAFICVLIPWDVFTAVGSFDERFTAYGSEDNDYCIRVNMAGLRIGVYDPCIVAHDGVSTFRSRKDNIAMLEKGRRTLREKWG
jgi:GT2 family glycosyltransferase